MMRYAMLLVLILLLVVLRGTRGLGWIDSSIILNDSHIYLIDDLLPTAVIVITRPSPPPPPASLFCPLITLLYSNL